MTYHVTPVWDAEHRIYRSVRNIAGLHIEAPTLEEFQEVVLDVAPELIVANQPGATAQSKRLFFAPPRGAMASRYYREVVKIIRK